MKILITSDTHHGISGNQTTKINRKFWQKMAKKDFDILIHAGDWCSTKSDTQFRSAIKQCRQYIDKPILTVFGNHDFWSQKLLQPGYILDSHRKVCHEFDIYYLGDGPVHAFSNISIYGFDGWYHSITPPTNDKFWLPLVGPYGKPIHEYLNKKSFNDFCNIESQIDENRYNICVTHFSPLVRPDDYKGAGMSGDPNFLPLITDKCKMLIVGHSHNYLDIVKNNCNIVEAGSDYNDPQFLIKEV